MKKQERDEMKMPKTHCEQHGHNFEPLDIAEQNGPGPRDPKFILVCRKCGEQRKVETPD
jgi:hypothetical protein